MMMMETSKEEQRKKMMLMQNSNKKKKKRAQVTTANTDNYSKIVHKCVNLFTLSLLAVILIEFVVGYIIGDHTDAENDGQLEPAERDSLEEATNSLRFADVLGQLTHSHVIIDVRLHLSANSVQRKEQRLPDEGDG